ncbi:MAG: ankyrin repeat domain-containing protein [Candidatus Dependentiae bacterium]|nr:ankyrin repeat domain-containing protein [Candidatus Dependentiae bacterium]
MPSHREFFYIMLAVGLCASPLSGVLDSSDQLPANALVHEIITDTTPCELIKVGQLKTVLKHAPGAANAKNKSGTPALHVAVHQGDLCLVQCLIENGADHTRTDKNGKPAWSYLRKNSNGAAIAAYLKLVQDFYAALEGSMELDIFANKHLVNEQKFKAVGALLLLNNDPELRKSFLSYRAEWLEKKHKRLFAILQNNSTTESTKISKFKKLLESYPSAIRARTALCGVTALHYAFWKGYTNVMLLLLTSGADINEPDGEGMTMLHWASYLGQDDMVRFLLKHAKTSGLDCNIRTWTGGKAPLHFSVTRGKIAIAKMLIRASADINITDKDGATALGLAYQNRDFDASIMLLRHGADPLLTSGGGKSAYDLCLEDEKPDRLAECLILSAQFCKLIRGDQNFSEFAAKYLKNKKNLWLVKMLLLLDKNLAFAQKFMSWRQKERAWIYRPAQIELAEFIRRKKIIPSKKFFQKFLSAVGLASMP